MAQDRANGSTMTFQEFGGAGRLCRSRPEVRAEGNVEHAGSACECRPDRSDRQATDTSLRPFSHLRAAASTAESMPSRPPHASCATATAIAARTPALTMPRSRANRSASKRRTRSMTHAGCRHPDQGHGPAALRAFQTLPPGPLHAGRGSRGILMPTDNARVGALLRSADSSSRTSAAARLLVTYRVHSATSMRSLRSRSTVRAR